ncbi:MULTISPECIES: EcsC family protein [unclassified Mumia]|uniref:EcsC family protein n=2 Tax=Mumia TaxID=1546255 RepID=UPI00262E25CE|nr:MULTISPECIES: EcsC family protein [unclassified Mumia]MDD9350455.1 EcsC family protein [Mumia sp.]
MGIARTTAKMVGPRVAMSAGPKVTSGYVRVLLDRAIDGVGPFKPVRVAADARLALAGGRVEDAIDDTVAIHVRYAGAQGFLTNVGGIASMIVTVPANVTGLAVLQCHMVAAIAYLRGYDLDDPRVRNAVMACLLGKDEIKKAVKERRIPTTPMGLATSPVHDPSLDDRVAQEVTTALFGRVSGKQGASMIVRKVPLLGGGVGLVADARHTAKIASYARQELRDRRLALPR